MKTAIIYSSLTGNTKMVAQAIYDQLKKMNDYDVVYFGKVSDTIPQADIYIF